ACPDVEYSEDEAWVAINTAQFESAKNGTSICGKYIKVNRIDAPSEHHTYRVIDACKDCKKNDLGFSEAALRELTGSRRVALGWEL
ncbi:MAG: hypothetical protein J3Q66DRAFT_266124, partial [Benniella sp.]